MNTQTLAAAIQAAAYAYHNGLPLTMTDDEYDAAVDRLKALSPAHPVLAAVGAPVAAGDEVTLPIPLPSLNKIKADGSLQKWLSRFAASSYHVSAKLDGCSALWFPATGRLYTRGDGVRGRDISAFVPYFAGLIRSSKSIVAVRGELILQTNSPVIPAGKLARNIVAGALNRKDADVALFREIRFVAYELIEPADKTPEEAYTLLRSAGYEVARATVLPAADATEARLSELFSTAEAASPYQMDGIVVSPNVVRPAAYNTVEVRTTGAVNPVDRVAWKQRLTATSAMTTVRAVEWNVSASGILIPRVLFDTVTLAGANISAATGLHGRWIYDNGVGPGAVVEIRRAGDVIPQIVAVHVASIAAMPARYTWEPSGVHIRPVGDDVAAESEQIRITRALTELGAENVGAGVVAKLYEAGFTSVGAIYAATQADFAARVAGCKAKSAEKIWTGLRCKQASWTTLDILCASCCMPRGVARSKLQTLLICNADPTTWTAAALQATRPAGLSDKTIEEIVAAVPACLSWSAANAIIASAPIIQTEAGSSGSRNNGPSFNVVLTGFRDKALEAMLVATGHTVADAVTKKTTHVVHPDGPTPTSTKIAKARDAGVAVMSVSEFKTLVGTA